MTFIDELNRHILSFDDAKSIDILMEDIGDAQFVLMGEASHGTQEFYQTRMQLSQRLIEEKGFMAIGLMFMHSINIFMVTFHYTKPMRLFNDFQTGCGPMTV